MATNSAQLASRDGAGLSTDSTSNPPQFPFTRLHGVEPAPENTELRQKCPVTKVKLFDGSEAWVVMDHKEIFETLASDSEKLSADRRYPGYPEIHAGGAKAKEARAIFVNLDNPEHDKQRNMLANAFTPQAVEKMRPLFQDSVDKLLDQLIKKGNKHNPVDLMENFASQVPTQIIFKILGVPEEDIEQVSKDSEIRHSTSRNAAETSNKNLNDYVEGLVNKRIDKSEDDMISQLVQQYKEGNLEKEDVTTLAFTLLTAGNAAILNSIGLGAFTPLQHPDQLAEFKDPSLARQVINEILRFHTVSALNCRRAVKEDITIGGQHIKKNEGVICAV